MITYRDQAWCATSPLCRNVDCIRNYSQEERERNIETVNLPIAQTEFKTDDCGFEPVSQS